MFGPSCFVRAKFTTIFHSYYKLCFEIKTTDQFPILRAFLSIFLPTVSQYFKKLRFRQSF